MELIIISYFYTVSFCRNPKHHRKQSSLASSEWLAVSNFEKELLCSVAQRSHVLNLLIFCYHWQWTIPRVNSLEKRTTKSSQALFCFQNKQISNSSFGSEAWLHRPGPHPSDEVFWQASGKIFKDVMPGLSENERGRDGRKYLYSL